MNIWSCHTLYSCWQEGGVGHDTHKHIAQATGQSYGTLPLHWIVTQISIWPSVKKSSGEHQLFHQLLMMTGGLQLTTRTRDNTWTDSVEIVVAFNRTNLHLSLKHSICYYPPVDGYLSLLDNMIGWWVACFNIRYYKMTTAKQTLHFFSECLVAVVNFPPVFYALQMVS